MFLSSRCGWRAHRAPRCRWDGSKTLVTSLDPAHYPIRAAAVPIAFNDNVSVVSAFSSASQVFLTTSDGETVTFPWGAKAAVRSYGPAERVDPLTMAGDDLIVRNLAAADTRRTYRVAPDLVFRPEAQDLLLARSAGDQLAWLAPAPVGADGNAAWIRPVNGAASGARKLATVPYLSVDDAGLGDGIYAVKAHCTNRSYQQHNVVVAVDVETGSTSWRELPQHGATREFRDNPRCVEPRRVPEFLYDRGQHTDERHATRSSNARGLR
jgi:hypothetical protein